MKYNNFSIPNSRKPSSANRTGQVSIQKKFIVFSIVFFLLVFLFGSGAFIIIMGRIMHDHAGHELMQDVETELLRFETSVNVEIAVVLKMAGSPLIRRYFANPDNIELKELALEEIEAYRRTFSSKSVFYANDKDKLFYTDDIEPYLLDPENPENYWWNMTLYETDSFNFNINYNSHLGVINLWINAPVFDNDGKPVGMLGTGMNLSYYIESIYRNFPNAANMYFFNSAGEITGARDIDLIANKILIKDHLGQTGSKILAMKENIEAGGIKGFHTIDMRGVAVLGKIQALDWYLIAYKHFSIWYSLRTGITVLFIIMIMVIFAIIVVFNLFAAGLLQESDHAKGCAEAARDTVISGIKYASKIQKNLLRLDSFFDDAFSDYSVIWKPRDIVGGDIYWIKNFDEGTVLCVCDCTGHGTSGAFLTMLVVSAFEASITEKNCKNTADIIWELEKRLVSALNVETINEETGGFTIKDGCDLAVLFIAKDGRVTCSSGHMPVFACDGKNVTRYKGQNIFVGEGRLKSRDEIETVHIPANPCNKFYIASDGLFDQPGEWTQLPFGYGKFNQIILENHNLSQTAISEKVWAAFEEYRGDEPRVDDLQMISFNRGNIIKR